MASAAEPQPRAVPNILITGTPCTGKTRLATELVGRVSELKHISVSEYAISNRYVTEYDPEYETNVLDEDRLLDALEIETANGGRVIEYHNSELFPERWFDAVLVTRCSNTTLYNRMAERGYASDSRKSRENLECEIFGVCLEEARDSYREDIVFELKSETEDDLRRNIDFIINWIAEWKSKPRNPAKRATRGGTRIDDDDDDDDEDYELDRKPKSNKKRVKN